MCPKSVRQGNAAAFDGALRTMTGRSNLVAFLVVGLLIGALAGYLTRPESAQIKLGPLTF